jgi:hypothetical protein
VQLVPSGRGALVQPPGPQVSVVHSLPSLHWALDGVPAQAPPPHVSDSVQATLSLQESVLFVMTHPLASAEGLAGLQASVVQPLPSLQRELTGVPTHAPPEQVSGRVQNTPSSHALVLFV